MLKKLKISVLKKLLQVSFIKTLKNYLSNGKTNFSTSKKSL